MSLIVHSVNCIMISRFMLNLRSIHSTPEHEGDALEFGKPFQLLVAQQQEKNRRDRLWRDRLSKEKRQEQQRHDRREEQLNRAMNQRRQNPVMPKQHRNKKSMSSAFFQLMRPNELVKNLLSALDSKLAANVPKILETGCEHR